MIAYTKAQSQDKKKRFVKGKNWD